MICNVLKIQKKLYYIICKLINYKHYLIKKHKLVNFLLIVKIIIYKKNLLVQFV